MSSADDVAKQAICKAYLREMFELNPMWQSSQILRRRREIWTGKSNPINAAGKFVSASMSGVADDEDDAATLRNQERVRRCMETLQEQFYQLPADKLSQYLRFVQSDKRPEINVKVKRLTAVAEHRNALLQLQRESSDSKFSYSLCIGLISPPAQAGSLKEQYIESVIAEKRVGPSCKMVRKFVNTHPGVYQLERDWFDLFLDPATERQWSSRYSLQGRFKSVTGNNRVNVLAFVGLFIFFAVIRAVNTEPKKSPQRQPTFRLVKPAMNQPVETLGGLDSAPDSGVDDGQELQRSKDTGISEIDEQLFAPPDLPPFNPPNFELPPQFGPRGLDRAGRKSGQLGGGQFP